MKRKQEAHDKFLDAKTEKILRNFDEMNIIQDEINNEKHVNRSQNEKLKNLTAKLTKLEKKHK